jgi:hypothetical protein
MGRKTPPDAKELEVSLFGPGIGECVVVHLGFGEWMIVDSCLNEAGTKAIAVEYLETIGVSLGDQIKLVVASHWHDDHIKGLSQVIQNSPSARFACSDALRCEEFLALLEADTEIKLVEHTSGVSEFASILRILKSRSRKTNSFGPHHWASTGACIYLNNICYNIKVHALSPSSQAITDARRGLAGLIPTVGQSIRHIPTLSPNSLCVVLFIETIGARILLGADLETGTDSDHGWRAIIRSPVRQTGAKSIIFKVAHHGSANADLDDVWRDMLEQDACSVLTPYGRGPNPLPSQSDVARMKRRTNCLYCTAWPPTKSPPNRDPAADRTMKEMTLYRRAIRKNPGQIRVRVPIDGKLNDVLVEVFDGALKL